MKCSGIADEAGKPIDVQIKAHKELGWDDIEIRTIDGVNLTSVPDEVFDEIYSKVTEAGFTVSSFASELCNWSRPITTDFQVDIDELTRAIPRMQKFNSKIIRIMSYPNSKENPWPDDEWRDEAIRRIGELTKMAEDGGIMLAHENCNGWAGESPENTLYMVEKINSPALKVIFDTGNTVSHGQDSYEFYDKVKEHVVHIHVKDALKDGDTYRHCFPGEGLGQVPEVIADLKKSGYEGAISIEPHVAAVIHLDKDADDPEAGYNAYIKYGKMLMDIIEAA
jgi:sugar phosphate isomerase/epimerase